MHSYPEPALDLVARMNEAAAADPSRAAAFQGAPGCNSHRAALEHDPDCLPLPCFSFEDALDAVKDGRADRAIIPIENSQHGRVADIHFLLPESGLSIVGEHFMGIEHALMALPNADGTMGPFSGAYSHPQALGEKAVTTFIFEVKNIPAALYKALGGFATNGVNMTKLESYQIGASFAATTFYADIEGAPGEPRIDMALQELAFHCKYVRPLGTYKQARSRG